MYVRTYTVYSMYIGALRFWKLQIEDRRPPEEGGTPLPKGEGGEEGDRREPKGGQKMPWQGLAVFLPRDEHATDRMLTQRHGETERYQLFICERYKLFVQFKLTYYILFIFVTVSVITYIILYYCVIDYVHYHRHDHSL